MYYTSTVLTFMYYACDSWARAWSLLATRQLEKDEAWELAGPLLLEAARGDAALGSPCT